MKKTILITGATDGIGFEACKILAQQGHELLIHGRNQVKLDSAKQMLLEYSKDGNIRTYLADLSDLDDTKKFADQVMKDYENIDVLINNAGVYKSPYAANKDGYDIRFIVNVVAPYLLTTKLLPIINNDGRIVNLSSAAQSRVQTKLYFEKKQIPDAESYSQSKLAIILWGRALVSKLEGQGPAIIALNPGSLLATNMVKEAFGVKGKDINIGGEIIASAATGAKFAKANNEYFDNDSGSFAPAHFDAEDKAICKELVEVIEEIIEAS